MNVKRNMCLASENSKDTPRPSGSAAETAAVCRAGRCARPVRLLLLLLILTALFSVGVPAAEKLRLSRTRQTVYTGEQVTLTVRGAKRKVRWSVSGAKLVSVRARGFRGRTAVIRAKKRAGSCVVVAKVGKRELRCRLTVKKHNSEPTPTPSPVQPTYRETDEAVLGLAEASVGLFKGAAKEAGGSNVLISPYSILTALSFLESGAKGSTLLEMERLMGTSAKKSGECLMGMSGRLSASQAYTFRSANALFVREGVVNLKAAFADSAKKLFCADVITAPFDQTTVNAINRYAEEKTEGKIRGIVDKLDPSALTVLINALYFKGEWGTPYEETVSRRFTDSAGAEKNVPMLEGSESAYVTLMGAQGFIKAYRGGELAFLGLLPPEGMSPERFLDGLTGEAFVNAVKNAVTTGVKVYTRMPEFTTEYELRLNSLLQKLGVRTAFTDSADFSGMSDMPTRVDDVLHKTYLKLDKNGTEAAAVTAIVAKASSIPARPPEIRYVYLDRPFVYALIDRASGLPLFLGTVNRV